MLLLLISWLVWLVLSCLWYLIEISRSILQGCQTDPNSPLFWSQCTSSHYCKFINKFILSWTDSPPIAAVLFKLNKNETAYLWQLKQNSLKVLPLMTHHLSCSNLNMQSPSHPFPLGFSHCLHSCAGSTLTHVACHFLLGPALFQQLHIML